MKVVIIIFLTILYGQMAFGQGYGVGDEFYPNQVPSGKSYDQKYWKKQVKKLSRRIEKNPNDSERIYSLAIAKSRLISNDLTDVILLLDKAIEIDSTQAKYFAVRGIVKYDWGAYSPDFDISEGCPDILKALNLGLEVRLKNNEAINGILNHPSCNKVKSELLGNDRSILNSENFDHIIANHIWGRIDQYKEESVSDNSYSYSVIITDSSFLSESLDFGSLKVSCKTKIELDNNLLKIQDFTCDAFDFLKFCYGFFENGFLYLTFDSENFDLNDDLVGIVKTRLGWAKYEIVTIEK